MSPEYIYLFTEGGGEIESNPFAKYLFNFHFIYNGMESFSHTFIYENDGKSKNNNSKPCEKIRFSQKNIRRCVRKGRKNREKQSIHVIGYNFMEIRFRITCVRLLDFRESKRPY